MSATIHGLAPARRVLDNGAAVIVQETHHHPAVTLHVMLRAGSAHDPADQPGLAHFVSRVIDRGSARRGADAIAELLDGRGVTLTASVGRHTLTLACTCLSEDLPDVLDVVAEIVQQPVFPPEEIETRRGEIVTSIRQDEDNPAVVALDGLMGLLYPDGHPYGRRTKGLIATVEAIARPDLAGFHQTRFTPADLVVVVVGDVRTASALDATARAFGEWRSAPAGRLVPPPVRPAARRQRLIVPMMSKAQVDIAYGFTAATRLDPQYHALTLMNNVLGQYGLGGRLGDSIRERQGMAYYAFSSFDGNVAEGPLVVRAGVAPADVDRTIASIDAEIRLLVQQGVTAAELSDAKRYMIGSLPRLLETNDGIAAFLQNVEFFDLGIDYDRRLPGLLEAVGLADVNAAARRVLDPDRAALVIAGPYEPGAQPGSDAV